MKNKMFELKIKKRNIWVSESLYQEIKLSQESLRKNNKRKVTMLEASDRLGKYLNTMRNNKI